MTMILDRNKAFKLLKALDTYCGERYIKLSKGNISLAKMIINRYHSVVLLGDDGTMYLCNNPRHLKKYAMQESLRKTNPFITPNCDGFTKNDSL